MTLDYWTESWVQLLPRKIHLEDTGIDLAICEKIEQFNENTICYDTGIHFKIPPGYWLLLTARSSLGKSGYMLSNSVGIIDNGYRGSIKVCLTKIDSSSPELTLPCYCIQIILMELRNMELRNIIPHSTILEETSRSQGGFGSTDLN
jgi:dUTP pyrophosphatase